MSVRLATFNMENLFSRPMAMNQATWAEGRPALEAFARLSALLEQAAYSAADKTAIETILEDYGPGAAAGRRFIRVEQIRERLYKGQAGAISVVASGRGDWAGWADLVREDVRWGATHNTGRVVEAVAPDVMLAVEVEDRLTLQRFNDQVLDELGVAFPYNTLLDGNDPRGIDIGLLSRFPIRSLRSHLFDTDATGRIFSRDCPEFEIELPSGQSLWVLGNHWKSKGYGSPAATTEKRLRQATRVEEIYREALTRSPLVAVLGDLNDAHASAPVQVLADAGLQEAMQHPSYTGTPGTFGTGNSENQKLDYVLLSPVLWGQVEQAGVERHGVYAPSLTASIGPLFATSKVDQASDHSPVWVDLDL